VRGDGRSGKGECRRHQARPRATPEREYTARGNAGQCGLSTRSRSIAQGTDTAADAIARQISAITIATGLKPDGVVLNPADFLLLQLSKNTGGDYYSGDPFATPEPPTPWGVPVVKTGVVAAGQALVGAFTTGAGLFRKGGIRVEASNFHSDFFVKNLVAIRAETRVALAVYRPSAFGEVTGLI
jgi:HK97 family phage major capsid protein